MTTTVKFQFNSELRRVVVPGQPPTLRGLADTAMGLFPGGAAEGARPVFDFVDEENDVVAVASDDEVREAMALAEKNGRILKLRVTFKPNEERAKPAAFAQQDAPLGALARVLADPAIVASLQDKLGSSIVREAVNDVALAYLTAPNLPEIAATHRAVQHIPVLRTVWQDLVAEHADLTEAASKLSEAGMLLGPLFGASHGPAVVHVDVYCDGCAADAELKAAAVLARTVSAEGFIAGPRFTSAATDDFDLCEACHAVAAERFAAHMPFKRITAQRHSAFPSRTGAADADADWRSGARRHGPHARGGGPPFRGCRGSGAHRVAESLRDLLVQGASAFAQASEGSELADIARAVSLSLQQTSASPTTTTTAAAATGAAPVPAAATAKDAAERQRKAVEELRQMGFADADKFARIIEEEKGDMGRVLARIVG